ncbi:lysozyme inhibitor LprI family protein [Chromobacterium sp. IIBBL 290-4]|uniref:lysozyme inhibitor LprI family protein n=1 Tax=Chromobacterium sp. IIBBL 290-4 TaxID=2953890 RepID=UPI0020B65C9C|nr:lysozyme inhibitor LprI family protein [Chromobacterium sp. IIBBL 290-4]UTH75507.1 lysozyme inhibitor LprI family protein [Chromobacterium sp. IIBBL 290-4]
MINRTSFAGALLLGLLSAPAFSCGDEAMLYSADYDQCMNQAASTAAMLDCIHTEHGKQDKLLNDNYKKLMAQFSSKRQPRLLAAQRLWLQYREANCQAYVDPDGGTAEALTGADCMLRATAERAAELAKMQPEQH